MNRRRAREALFLILFQYEFRGNIEEILGDFFSENTDIGEQENYIRKLCEWFIFDTEAINETIGKYSKNWKFERISMVSLAVLRLSICEILYFDDIPIVVSIAEALELAKKFEGEESVPFINGVLEGVRLEAEAKK